MKKNIFMLLLVLMLITSNFAFSQTQGDVNNDSNVNIVDALLIAQKYVGLDPSGYTHPENGDVDCNKQVNIVDALLIAQLYVGSIDSFKVCSPAVTPVPVDPKLAFVDWLVKYIPAAYPEIKVDTHYEAGGAIVWYQAIWNPKADNEFVASWSELGPNHSLGAVEGKYEGKALFLAAETDKGWNDPAAEFTEGVGYYITGYKSSTMSKWDVSGITVVQFDGESRDFVDKMVAARKSN